MKSRINRPGTSAPSESPYRTSISGVPPKIFNRAKKFAAKQRLTFSALVINALETYVAAYDRNNSR